MNSLLSITRESREKWRKFRFVNLRIPTRRIKSLSQTWKGALIVVTPQTRAHYHCHTTSMIATSDAQLFAAFLSSFREKG